MKTVSGKVTSTTPITLSDAAKFLYKFAASDHGASHAVSLYIQRAAGSFNQLVKVHEKLSPNCVKKEHSTDDIKVEEISESRRHHKKNRDVGLKVEDLVKNEDIPNGSRRNKKSKNLGKEENPEADARNKISSNIDEVNDQKLINTKQRLDIGEGEIEKSKKNELEFVKTGSSVKTEQGFEAVKEDGMISRDKKKRKNKNRGVGDSECEVGKMEEDLGDKERKSMVDPVAGENAGSAEQSNKKKSKRRRIEGESN